MQKAADEAAKAEQKLQEKETPFLLQNQLQ